MSIFGMIVTYVVVWWIVLFAVLPWGVRSQIESDQQSVSGSDLGAPKKSYIGLKFLVTTILSLFVWGFFVSLFYMDIIAIRDFL
ncbi:MAG: putative secreted protein [Alphaproteobacteria bacterium]|jgi:predicted secreted protein